VLLRHFEPEETSQNLGICHLEAESFTACFNQVLVVAVPTLVYLLLLVDPTPLVAHLMGNLIQLHTHTLPVYCCVYVGGRHKRWLC